MNWKKNGFSYILWIVYTVMVSVGVLGITSTICYRTGYPKEYGIGITLGCFLLVGLMVWGIRKLWCKSRVSRGFGDSTVLYVAEGLLVVILLFLGIYLRLDFVLRATTDVAGMAYYEAAMVTSGSSVPQVVHGATYLYLQLLHLLLVLIGNKLAAAVVFQIVLQLLTGVVLYVAVRKLSGVKAAMIATAFLMLSPYMVSLGLELSPAFLFLLIYLIALLCVAGILQKNEGNPLWYLLAGIVAGVVCYLDIFGITLLLVLGTVAGVERGRSETFWNSRTGTFLFGVLGCLLGFVVTIGIDAGTSGKSVINVLAAWAQIYKPGDFEFVTSTDAVVSYADGAILFGVLIVGVFGFWCRRKWERHSLWITVTTVLIALQCLQMMIQNAGSQAYVYIFLAILAGVGVESVLTVDVVEAEEPVEVTVEEGGEVSEETVMVSPEPPKVQFLENPLPLPKKHEPKVMDYPMPEVKEGSDYDYDVADDDDYDIL